LDHGDKSNWNFLFFLLSNFGGKNAKNLERFRQILKTTKLKKERNKFNHPAWTTALKAKTLKSGEAMGSGQGLPYT
jgi:hypothetical protein